MTLAAKTLFISGGSHSIGLAIAIRAKYGMPLCGLGFAAEFADDGIASHAQPRQADRIGRRSRHAE